MQPASATRPTRPLVLVALFGLLGAGGPPGATWADEGNPRIDYRRFKAEVAEVETLRESRRVDEDAFLEMAADPQTVILDARSREKYDLVHVRGARHLSFPDISADELSKVIPTKDTRVLIYCNNNFEGEPVGFFPKLRSAALNVHTFTTLHAYGYTNVYELKPLLDVRTTKIPFAGRGVDDRGRAGPR